MENGKEKFKKRGGQNENVKYIAVEEIDGENKGDR